MLSQGERQYLESPTSLEKATKNVMKFRIRKKYPEMVKTTVKYMESGRSDVDMRVMLAPLIDAYLATYGPPGQKTAKKQAPGAAPEAGEGQQQAAPSEVVQQPAAPVEDVSGSYAGAAEGPPPGDTAADGEPDW